MRAERDAGGPSQRGASAKIRSHAIPSHQRFVPEVNEEDNVGAKKVDARLAGEDERGVATERVAKSTLCLRREKDQMR